MEGNKLKSNISGPNPAQTQGRFPCSICNRELSSEKALFGHMRVHPERPYRGMLNPGLGSGSGSVSGSDESGVTVVEGWKAGGKRTNKGFATEASVSGSPSSSIVDDDVMAGVELQLHLANGGFSDDGRVNIAQKNDNGANLKLKGKLYEDKTYSEDYYFNNDTKASNLTPNYLPSTWYSTLNPHYCLGSTSNPDYCIGSTSHSPLNDPNNSLSSTSYSNPNFSPSTSYSEKLIKSKKRGFVDDESNKKRNKITSMELLSSEQISSGTDQCEIIDLNMMAEDDDMMIE